MRILHRLYAWLFGYFWLPCHLCGKYWGGHEWVYAGQSRDGHDICQDCFKKHGPERIVINLSPQAGK